MCFATDGDGGDSKVPTQEPAKKKLGKFSDDVKPLKPSAKLEALLLSMKRVSPSLTWNHLKHDHNLN